MPTAPPPADPLSAYALAQQRADAQAVREQSAAALLRDGDPAPSPTCPFAVLRFRQRQVVALLAEGLAAEAIAGRLGLLAKTVAAYARDAAAAAGVSGVAGLTRYAVREGLAAVDG